MTDTAAQEQRLAKAWARPKGWAYFSDVNNSVIGGSLSSLGCRQDARFK